VSLGIPLEKECSPGRRCGQVLAARENALALSLLCYPQKAPASRRASDTTPLGLPCEPMLGSLAMLLLLASASIAGSSAVEMASRCTGSESAALAPAQCEAWQAFHDAAFTAAAKPGCERNDPCACGQGQGVQCKGADIATITLGELKLQGTISAALAQMVNLEVLELGFNGLRGTIPASIGQLASLRMLILTNNSLSGHVPALNFTQFHDLHGGCALGGSGNDFCSPLPAGADTCQNMWGNVTTHPC
jgi:hypothetical protein